MSILSKEHDMNKGVSQEVLGNLTGYSLAIITTLCKIGNGKTGAGIASASGCSTVPRGMGARSLSLAGRCEVKVVASVHSIHTETTTSGGIQT